MGELFNPTKGGGVFTILQDTPALTSDASGLYALDFTIPGNTLGETAGVLLVQDYQEYTFQPGWGSGYGIVFYNAGDTFEYNNLGRNGLATGAGVVSFVPQLNGILYIDDTNTTQLTYSSFVLTGGLTPGVDYESSAFGIPNVSGVIDWTQDVTIQLVFAQNSLPVSPPPAGDVVAAGVGFTRLILMT
ncbi:MAG: hypothetical protein ACRD33_00125 [Candidatus Acidiferrales bacterium]